MPIQLLEKCDDFQGRLPDKDGVFAQKLASLFEGSREEVRIGAELFRDVGWHLEMIWSLTFYFWRSEANGILIHFRLRGNNGAPSVEDERTCPGQ